ncbi:MAG: PAS domain S-box protein [Proteobacteria bacterium]|nr:PAS domain S-box protein [Pseudomonadota bacterium]
MNEQEPARRCILVVEDDEGLSNLAQNALRKAGYDTEGVNSGAQTIEHVKAHPGIVLLLDIKLPDMTGSEIIQRLIEGDCLVPFIVMTGHGNQRTAVEMMKLGASDYLVKGLDLIDRLPLAFLHLFNDLDTKRQLRLAQEELARSDQILSRSADMMALVDKNFFYLATNPSYLYAVRKTKHEVIGHTMADVFGEELFESVIRPSAERCLTGEEITYQDWFELPPRPRRYLDITYSPYIKDDQIEGFVVKSRDITKRRRRDELLHQTSKLLQFYIARTPLAFMIFDMNLRITEWNESATRIFGFSKEETMGKPILELIVPDEALPQVVKTLKGLIDGEISDYSESDNNITKDGRIISCAWFNTPLLADDGSVIALACMAQDITERKRMEASLAESEQRYHSMVESTVDGIIVSDAAGVVTSWNKGASNIFGYRASEIVGKPFTALMPEAYWRRHNEGMRRLVRTDESQQIGQLLELEGVRKDGTLFPMELSLSTWQSEDNRFFAGICRDISERKAQMSELNLAATTFEAQEAIVITDPTGIILAVNKAYQEMTGYQADEIVGTHATILWPENNFPSAAIEREARWQSKSTYTDAMGTLHPMEVTTSAVTNVDGTVTHYVGHITDVTELRGKELALEQALKMEAIGQLSGGIAHDFNNLLNIILGNLGYIREALPERPGDLEEMFNDVFTAVEDGAHLTRRLLSFTRSSDETTKPINIVPLITGFSSFLTRALGDRIELTLDFSDEAMFIALSPHGLENAILNLAVNANDAMPGGGTLNISVSATHSPNEIESKYGISVDGDCICIKVADTGSGIAPEYLDKVRQPFFSTKPIDKGTGLGLPMVFDFAQRAGGSCHIASSLNVGTTVTLILPQTAEEEITSERVADETIKPGDETILIVEDNDKLLKVTRRIIAGFGYQVYSAENAEAARELIESGLAIDLVFSDIQMPGKWTGIELAELIRECHPDIKVLLTTGYSDRENVAEMFPTLAKPYSNTQVAIKLRELLD